MCPTKCGVLGLDPVEDVPNSSPELLLRDHTEVVAQKRGAHCVQVVEELPGKDELPEFCASRSLPKPTTDASPPSEGSGLWPPLVGLPLLSCLVSLK